MVLYLESLKFNCESYIRLAEVVRPFLEIGSPVFINMEEAIRVAKANIETIEGLFSEGMTEIHVKHTPR